MHELCRRAIGWAAARGASYADARIIDSHTQGIFTEDRRVASVDDSSSVGMGVRVICRGSWGFASGPDLSRAGVERTAARAVEVAKASGLARARRGVSWADEPPARGVFRTPFVIDPFAIPVRDKAGLLLSIADRVLRVRGVKKCVGWMWFMREKRWFANTEGASFLSDVVTSVAQYTATAVDGSTAKSRSLEAHPANAGYEHVNSTPLLDDAVRVGEEAVAKLKGKPVRGGRRDLILMPLHLALTMHESIGHATELDRVLGMEESLAGSSFATIDKLGKLRYGSPLMNIVCDNTMEHGLATKGWDDDGVPGQRWTVIRDGILVDYQTSREVCGAIGAKRSRGSCRADGWGSIPIIRQSNIGLEPGRGKLSLEELISDTRDGILIDGMGSFSIDQKRLNFQFGGDLFREIRNGKVGPILKDLVYQAITTEFWGSMDAICDRRFWRPFGVANCGKGDPGQTARMTHGSSPARFRKIRVSPA